MSREYVPMRPGAGDWRRRSPLFREPFEPPCGDALLQRVLCKLVPRADWDVIADRIYFVGCNDEHVKIGYSGIFSQRFLALSACNPYPLKVLALLDCGAAYERALHRHFAELRGAFEWFRLDGQLREFLSHPSISQSLVDTTDPLSLHPTRRRESYGHCDTVQNPAYIATKRTRGAP